MAGCAAALLAVFWSCRGAPLGTPAADDYTFLSTLLEQPLDFLGPMGSPVYWRPVSRQLYFLLLGPGMVEHPVRAVVLHVVLLVLLFAVLYRIARRGFSPANATAIAAFPLTAEPVRVLLGWPTGGEYLLAALGSALAIHETLANRRVTGAIAAGFAMASHEAAILLLPAMVGIVLVRTRSVRHALPWIAIACGLGVLFVIGHALARSHGMGLPSDAHHGVVPWAALAEVGRRGLTAQIVGEDVRAPWSAFFLACWIAWGVWVLAGVRHIGRLAIARAVPMVIGGAAWFAIGLVPSAFVFPDWNGWRTFYPSLGLGFAAVAACGSIAPPVAPALIGLRLLQLFLAAPAPAVVEAHPEPTRSDLSFHRLVRLQRTVESTRRALLRRYPSLPHGARVRYWRIPALTEYGFQGPRAARVWYHDGDLSWETFDGDPSHAIGIDAFVEYDVPRASPAEVIEPHAIRGFADGLAALEQERWNAADALFADASRAQTRHSGPLLSSLAHQRALLAVRSGAWARAESLNALDADWAGRAPASAR